MAVNALSPSKPHWTRASGVNGGGGNGGGMQDPIPEGEADEEALLGMIYARLISSEARIMPKAKTEPTYSDETKQGPAPPPVRTQGLGSLRAFPRPETSNGSLSYNDGESEVWLAAAPEPSSEGVSPTPTSLGIGRHLRRRPAFAKTAPMAFKPPTPKPYGAVKKEQQLNEKTLTRARAAKTPLATPAHLPPGMLEGVLLTRSKSQRDRLVQRSAQLAQGVEAAAAEAACSLGFPTTQVVGLPMTRSAASELAISLGDMMT